MPLVPLEALVDAEKANVGGVLLPETPLIELLYRELMIWSICFVSILACMCGWTHYQTRHYRRQIDETSIIMDTKPGTSITLSAPKITVDEIRV